MILYCMEFLLVGYGKLLVLGGFSGRGADAILFNLWVTCIAILIYSSNPSYAFDVTLAWDANTEPDLAGYGIYYDTDSGDPFYGRGASDGDSPVDISLDQDEDPDPNVVQFTLYDLPRGNLFLRCNRY